MQYDRYGVIALVGHIRIAAASNVCRSRRGDGAILSDPFSILHSCVRILHVPPRFLPVKPRSLVSSHVSTSLTIQSADHCGPRLFSVREWETCQRHISRLYLRSTAPNGSVCCSKWVGLLLQMRLVKTTRIVDLAERAAPRLPKHRQTFHGSSLTPNQSRLMDLPNLA